MDLSTLNLSSEPNKVIEILLEEEKRQAKYHVAILEQAKSRIPKFTFSFPTPAEPDVARKPAVAIEMKLSEEFDYVRKAAMEMLKNNVSCKTYLFITTCICKHTPAHNIHQIPHNVFSWSFQDFLRRRKVQNLDFDLRMLKKNVPPECLELLKFQTDYIILKNRLSMVFAADKDTQANSKNVLKEFSRDLSYLNIYESLKSNINQNIDKVQEEIDTLNEIGAVSKVCNTKESKDLLKEQLNNLDAWYPIELRYQMNWLKAKQDQYQMRCNNEIKAVQDQIQGCKDEMDLDNFTTESKRTATVDEIEEFKSRYKTFKEKFDHSFEIAEYEISVMQRDIQQMKDQRKFQEREMIRFEIEIEDMEARLQLEATAEPVKRKPIVKKGCAGDAKKVKGKKGKKGY